ncbi:hypothetical protein [Nocardioides lijunqiniae]|uniref:hypothetical protein n=1 Tax=Nocardioides lijunqiniae TaxID=2760832 RepID=UPI001878CC10|nr:hypothetical protein [Nocardioides lijunqiniae]
MPRSPFSYANIASTLALVVTVGGGGVAVAAAVADNSVGTRQIKDLGVGRVDLARGAVDGRKVRDRSLTGVDVRDGTLTGADIDERSLVLPPASSNAVIRGGEPSGSAALAPSGTGMDVASLTFDAPADGVALVTVQAVFKAVDAGAGHLNVQVRDGDSDRFSCNWDAGDAGDGYDQHQSCSGVVPVAAGRHTYTLRITENQQPVRRASLYHGAQVLVVFQPGATQ